MAAVLTPSVNAFALLESDDPGDTRLEADVVANATAKRRTRKFYRREEPQMSQWKKNKVKAEAEEAAKKKLQQQLAAITNTNIAGRIRRPQQPAAPSRAPSVMATPSKNRKPQEPAAPPRVQVRTEVTGAMNMMKPKPPAASNKVHANTGANADGDEQFEQQPAAPAHGNLFDQLFAYANSFRVFIYGNRKQNGPANAKDGVAGGAPTNDKKGGRRVA